MKELEIRNLPELPFNVTEALNQLRINLSLWQSGQDCHGDQQRPQ